MLEDLKAYIKKEFFKPVPILKMLQVQFMLYPSGPKQYEKNPTWDQYKVTRHKAGEKKNSYLKVISIDGNKTLL
ncbi:MAG: hypothetical protein CM15mP33_04260 [Candidatus Neomarinimicrobiota bacterium]|nr:MAG: hypothetical protein CM15mP33_04260 [Candidatus Neomarinimicrobiota bacterium]